MHIGTRLTRTSTSITKPCAPAAARPRHPAAQQACSPTPAAQGHLAVQQQQQPSVSADWAAPAAAADAVGSGRAPSSSHSSSSTGRGSIQPAQQHDHPLGLDPSSQHQQQQDVTAWREAIAASCSVEQLLRLAQAAERSSQQQLPPNVPLGMLVKLASLKQQGHIRVRRRKRPGKRQVRPDAGAGLAPMPPAAAAAAAAGSTEVAGTHAHPAAAGLTQEQQRRQVFLTLAQQPLPAAAATTSSTSSSSSGAGGAGASGISANGGSKGASITSASPAVAKQQARAAAVLTDAENLVGRLVLAALPRMTSLQVAVVLRWLPRLRPLTPPVLAALQSRARQVLPSAWRPHVGRRLVTDLARATAATRAALAARRPLRRTDMQRWQPQAPAPAQQQQQQQEGQQLGAAQPMVPASMAPRSSGAGAEPGGPSTRPPTAATEAPSNSSSNASAAVAGASAAAGGQQQQQQQQLQERLDSSRQASTSGRSAAAAAEAALRQLPLPPLKRPQHPAATPAAASTAGTAASGGVQAPSGARGHTSSTGSSSSGGELAAQAAGSSDRSRRPTSWSSSSDGAPAGMVKVDPGFAREWVQRSAQHLHKFTPGELTSSLQSLATLGVTPSDTWVAAFCTSTQALLASGSVPPQQLPALLTGLADVGVAPPADWWSTYQSACTAVRWQLSGTGVASILASAARLQLRPEAEVVRELLWQGHRQIKKTDLEGLVLLLGALSKIGWRPAKGWLQAMCRQVLVRHRELTPALYARLLCAASRLGGRPGRAWLARVNGVVQGRLGAFTPQDYSNTLTAFARWRFLPNDAWMFDFLMEARAALPRFTAPAVVATAHALASLHSSKGYAPPQEWVAALLGRAGYLAPQLDPAAAAGLLASAAHLGAAPPVKLVAAGVEGLLQHLQQQQVAAAAAAAAAAGAGDTTAVEEAPQQQQQQQQLQEHVSEASSTPGASTATAMASIGLCEVSQLLWAVHRVSLQSSRVAGWVRGSQPQLQQLVAATQPLLAAAEPLQLRRLASAVAGLGCSPGGGWWAAHEAAVVRLLPQMRAEGLAEVAAAYLQARHPMSPQLRPHAAAAIQQQQQQHKEEARHQQGGQARVQQERGALLRPAPALLRPGAAPRPSQQHL